VEAEPTATSAPPEESTPPAAAKADDLKRIEGIGPKISNILRAAGIMTFAQLAETEPDSVRAILREANPNLLRLANPDTWPQQAQLAAEGDWEALSKLQDQLKGGRRV
jgi:predicted flap endonuclease-1-like 5' DNA nuclease